MEYALKTGYKDAREALAVSNMKWEHRTDTREERLDSVQTALDYVYEILDAYDDAVLITERQFTLDTYVSDDVGGTNDVIVIVPSLDLLFVLDFKHGAGEVVEVYENEQLQIYGLGGLEYAVTINGQDGKPLLTDNPVVVLVIMQPRAFHPKGPVREWTIDGDKLRAFKEKMEDAVLATQAPDAPLVPGKAQCRWCDAAVTCPAVERQAMQAMQANFSSVRLAVDALDGAAHTILPDPKDLPLDRLADILRLEPVVTAFFKKAYDEADAYARQGHPVPGFKLVEAQARRKYVGAPAETAGELMKLTGAAIDDVYPRKLIGITDGEKLIKAAYKERYGKGNARKAAEDAVKDFALLTVKDTSGTLVLVPMSDSRQAVTLGNQFAGAVSLPPTVEHK